MYKIKLLSVFLLIVLFGCANTYKFEKKVILNFTESSYNYFSSGVKGGGFGFNIFFKMDERDHLDDTKMKLKGIYFKGKYANFKSQGLGKYQAFIKQNNNSDRLAFHDHKGHKTEVAKEEVIPFVLIDSEAVISCLINEKLTYIKIILAKKKTKGFPM